MIQCKEVFSALTGGVGMCCAGVNWLIWQHQFKHMSLEFIHVTYKVIGL